MLSNRQELDLQNTFEYYASYRNPHSEGKIINLQQIDNWLRQCGEFGKKIIKSTVFSDLRSQNIEYMNLDVFKSFLKALSNELNYKYVDIMTGVSFGGEHKKIEEVTDNKKIEKKFVNTSIIKRPKHKKQSSLKKSNNDNLETCKKNPPPPKKIALPCKIIIPNVMSFKSRKPFPKTKTSTSTCKERSTHQISRTKTLNGNIIFKNVFGLNVNNKKGVCLKRDGRTTYNIVIFKKKPNVNKIQNNQKPKPKPKLITLIHPPSLHNRNVFKNRKFPNFSISYRKINRLRGGILPGTNTNKNKLMKSKKKITKRSTTKANVTRNKIVKKS